MKSKQGNNIISEKHYHGTSHSWKTRFYNLKQSMNFKIELSNLDLVKTTPETLLSILGQKIDKVYACLLLRKSPVLNNFGLR